MAIIDKVEITISSGGQILTEYDVPLDDDTVMDDYPELSPESSKVVKYIAAIPGANFEINYLVTEVQPFGGADFLSFKTWIDGHRILSPIATLENYLRRKGRYSKAKEGSESGSGSHWEMRPFIWRQLLTSKSLSRFCRRY